MLSDQTVKVYTGSDKSVTRILCALDRVNAVSTRNGQTERATPCAYCQKTTVSNFPQSSSVFASLHVVRFATMSAVILTLFRPPTLSAACDGSYHSCGRAAFKLVTALLCSRGSSFYTWSARRLSTHQSS